MSAYKEIAALPNVPANVDPQLRNVLSAFKRALEVRLGHVGDPMDRAVTLRELSTAGVYSGVSTSTPGTGGGGGTDPGEDGFIPIPDAPASVNIFQAWREIFIEIGFPVTNAIYLSNYEIWRVAGTDFNGAVLVGVGFNSLYVDTVNIEPNTTYTYWVRFVNTKGEPGPWYDNQGTSITTEDFSTRLLEDLSGKIRESELYQDLITKINLIDYPETGLVDRVGSIVGEVQELFALADALDAELTQQNILRVSGDEMLAGQITTLNANFNGVNAALQNEVLARSTADEAMAQQLTTLGAQVTSNYSTLTAAIQSEITARTTQDGVLAGQITNLAGQISSIEGMSATEVVALIHQEQQVLLDADTALAQDIQALESQITSINGMSETAVRAIVVDETQTLVNDVSALADDVLDLGAQISAYDGVTTSQVTALARQEVSAMVDDTGNALGYMLNQLQAQTDAADIAIANETIARSNKVGDLEAQYTLKIATSGGDNVIAGFGLAATQSGYDGSIHSSAIFRVDTFGVTAPNAETFSLIVEDGRVVMDGADIRRASIQSAAINSLQANKITAGLVTGLTLDGNTLRGGQIAIGTGTRTYQWQNYTYNPTTGLWQANASLTTSGAAFLVQPNGNTFVQNLYAENGYFRGDITGARGSFSGSLDAATGTFAGTLAARVVHNFEILSFATHKPEESPTRTVYSQNYAAGTFPLTRSYSTLARINYINLPAAVCSLIFGFTLGRTYGETQFYSGIEYVDLRFIVYRQSNDNLLAISHMNNVSIHSFGSIFQDGFLSYQAGSGMNEGSLDSLLSRRNIFSCSKDYNGALTVHGRKGFNFDFSGNTGTTQVYVVVDIRVSSETSTGPNFVSYGYQYERRLIQAVVVT